MKSQTYTKKGLVSSIGKELKQLNRMEIKNKRIGKSGEQILRKRYTNGQKDKKKVHSMSCFNQSTLG